MPTQARFRKRAIPAAVRREVARLVGGIPGSPMPAWCAACGEQGYVSWLLNYDGSPYWYVNFQWLEL